MSLENLPVAIVGSGPAGLMAAWVVAKAGWPVVVFEKKRGPAKKLLIAGSSGLNVSHQAPLEQFADFYRGDRHFISKILQKFTPDDWLKFIQSLGIQTFLGTSRRYFVDGLKAPPLLKAWIQKLKKAGVHFSYGQEVSGFNVESGGVILDFFDAPSQSFAAVCFCLGGGSYEPEEKPLRWPRFFIDKKIAFHPFEPANVGFEVDLPPALLEEAEGKPLKKIQITSHLGSAQGDAIITRYGLEGSPVYAVGAPGDIFLDLKPDMSAAKILERLQSKENLSPLRRIQKYLNLAPAATALLFHLAPPEILKDLNQTVGYLKKFPLFFKTPRPLDEAISSSGGIELNELTEDLMLRKYPGIFAAGEMLDWDAPTGGFLIQACVSQGHVAGRGILTHLAHYSGK